MNIYTATHYLKSYSDMLVVPGLVLAAMLLRGYDILNISPYPDESLYLIDSLRLISNDWVWPRESMFFQPPLFMYLEAATIRIFGSGLEVLRFISVIAGSLSVYLIYLLGKAMYDKRVGILSAVLLCFLSYHIRYSRITQLEIIEIFFILGTMYFFWKGYSEDKNVYLYGAGIFQGLALDTKYVGFTLFLAIILFILWTEKDWKALVNRKMLIFYGVSFLVFLPVFLMLYLNDVNIFYYNFIERQTMHYNSPSHLTIASKLPITELVARGFTNYIDMLTHGEYLLSWAFIFKLSASILFLVTMFKGMYNFLKCEKCESFLLIYFGISLGLVLFLYRFQYYLLYSLIAFILMCSYFAVSSFDHIRHNKYVLPKIPYLVHVTLMLIFVLSVVAAGTIAPVADKGEFDGFRTALFYMDKRLDNAATVPYARTTGFVVLAGADTLDIFISMHNAKNINYDAGSTPLLLLKLETGRSRDIVVFDLDTITMYKPLYIMVSKINYDHYLGSKKKSDVLKQYELVFSSKTQNPYSREYMVFRRSS